MCEFKINMKNEQSQILEEIVIISYKEKPELVLRDVVVIREMLESALILDVTTMNKKCTILENPIIKDFANLITKVSVSQIIGSNFDIFILKLEELKKN